MKSLLSISEKTGIRVDPNCCFVISVKLIVLVGKMSWPKTGANQYHAKLRLQDKVCATKGWLSAIAEIYSL